MAICPARGSPLPASTLANNAFVAWGPAWRCTVSQGCGPADTAVLNWFQAATSRSFRPCAPQSAWRFFDLGGRKEHHRARAGQLAGAAQIAHMACTHRAAVGQTGEVGMDALAQAHAASEVDVHAGCGAVEGVQCVVGDHAVVAAQAFAKRHLSLIHI